MKIAIYGAGAIGGYMGAMLVRSGEEVSLIARGPHLEAMQKNGLKLLIDEKEHISYPFCTDSPVEAGKQDYVIITLKAHSVPGIVDQLQPLLGSNTAVVTAMNGVPWWYFYKLPGEWENRRLESVDPGGKQWDGIGPERAIGCVVYPACEVVEPGVIKHISGDRFSVGEPSGEKTERVCSLSKAMINAGFKAPIRRIRDEIWLKLWGNLTFNPISALTHSTLEEICQYPTTRQLAATMMTEARTIGEKLGVNFRLSLEKRIKGAEQVGAHKTSMLQDVEAGRPMEIDAMLGAVIELGELTDTPMPTLEAVYACASLLNRTIQEKERKTD